MIEDAYRILESAEKSWWYTGRSLTVKNALKKVNLLKGMVLDYGSGYGAMFDLLHEYGEVTAIEPHDSCADVCTNKGYINVYSSIDEIINKNIRFSLVGMFDVLEHIEDDKTALNNIYNVLLPGGTLVLTVPAFSFLWGEHDTTHKHFRRYNKKELIDKAQKAGFKIEYCDYWNFLLFPLAVLVRLTGQTGSSTLNDKSLVNKILEKIIILETALLKNVPFPFGTGLIVIAKKSI